MAYQETKTKTNRKPGAASSRSRQGGHSRRPGSGDSAATFIPREFEQKLLKVARVSRMKAGGRRFHFRATIVIGDKAGRVGVGVAKGGDVAFAVEKATRNAKRNLFKVPMTPAGTIPYEIIGKQTSAKVLLMPAREGRGIIAGGAVRSVCELAGYRDISAKILSRSTNKLNNAMATVKALKSIRYTPPVAKIAVKEEIKEEKQEGASGK